MYCDTSDTWYCVTTSHRNSFTTIRYLTIFVSQHLFVALNRQICFAVTLCVTLGIYNFCCIPNKKTDEISENWINEILRMETVRLTNPNKMEICVFILKSLMINLIPNNVIPYILWPINSITYFTFNYTICTFDFRADLRLIFAKYLKSDDLN